MAKIICNADDFGYTRGTTYGIVDAHLLGIVTSTTALTVSEHFPHAMELAKELPNLGVGVHLTVTLNGAKPLTKKTSTLVDENGVFHSQYAFHEYVDPEEVYIEWKAQIQSFINTGNYPTHLDSHHDIHFHPKLIDVAVRLAEEFQLPLRRPEEKDIHKLASVPHTDLLEADFYDDNTTKEMLFTIFNNVAKKDKIAEFICHPAYIDSELSHSTSYLNPRLREFAILTDSNVKEYVANQGIELINFSYYHK